MDSAVSGGAKLPQLVGYCGDDPLAMAMAQSGIESGDQWSFLDVPPEPDGDVDFGQMTTFRSGGSFGQVTALGSCADLSQMTSLQPSDEDQMEDQLENQMEDELDASAAAVDGALDSWLSTYYYTVDDDPTDPAADPDDPDPDPTDDLTVNTDLSPASVLPRLVASLGWTDAARRPPFTFEELAALAICSSPERRLTAGLAADFVRRVYPFYRLHENRLQTSLEQALFASPYFRRLPGRGPLGRPWTVTAEGERRLADSVRRRLGADRCWRPARPAWQEDHNYAAEDPSTAAGRRRVKLATKT